MRNIATRDAPEHELKSNKWSSMPAIAINSVASQEEEIQEVAGRLEIRVVPKEVSKDSKDSRISSPVKIINEVSTKSIRDRKTELKEEELKISSNHGSKESITENTVQKPCENNVTVEDANTVQKIDNTILDKALEQVHCVLNVEKFEISREAAAEPENDLIKNSDDIVIVENNVPSPTKVNEDKEMSPKESLVVNDKEEKEINEEEVKEEVNVVKEEPVENKVQETVPKIVKKEIRCSPCIDLTTHPGVTFVPSNLGSQPETPR